MPKDEVPFVLTVSGGKAVVDREPAVGAKLVLIGKAADVAAIEAGELDPNVAFMQGRIKNTGDMDVLLDLFAQIHS